MPHWEFGRCTGPQGADTHATNCATDEEVLEGLRRTLKPGPNDKDNYKSEYMRISYEKAVLTARGEYRMSSGIPISKYSGSKRA